MKADCKIFPFWQIKNEVMLLAFQSRTVVENVNSANILIINLTIATEPIEKIVSDMLGFILKKKKNWGVKATNAWNCRNGNKDQIFNQFKWSLINEI